MGSFVQTGSGTPHDYPDRYSAGYNPGHHLGRRTIPGTSSSQSEIPPQIEVRRLLQQYKDETIQTENSSFSAETIQRYLWFARELDLHDDFLLWYRQPQQS